jgi:hypothetical protein
MMNAIVGDPVTVLNGIEFHGDTKALFPAFLKAQKAMEPVRKSATNPAFRSKYADLGALVEAVLPALHENGFGLMQPPHSDGALVEVETLLVHESGGYVRSILGLRPTKQDPQGVGSAITYARRYALQGLAGIAPEDDDGNAASAPRQARQEAPKADDAQPKPPTLAERADRLEATLKAVATRADLDKAYKLASGLCAELDKKDPERLVEINALYETRQVELDQ